MDEQETGTTSSQEEQESKPAAGATAADGAKSAAVGEQRDPLEGRSGDALAWLEGPAFNSPIEEMPTLQWPDVAKESDVAAVNQAVPVPPQAEAGGEPAEPADDLEDAILFLEGLAKEQGTPIEEMPTLVSGRESEQDSAWQDLGQLGDTTPPPSFDSDPMAWLEQLAMDQDSPLEELPSVANRLLASEIVSQHDAEAGDVAQSELTLTQLAELDMALQYLEAQAEAQGISLEDVSYDQLEPVEAAEEDLSALDRLAAGAAVAAVSAVETDLSQETDAEDEWDDLAAQIPEDPDHALAWLGELAEEESPGEEKDRSVLAKGAAAAGAAKLVHSTKTQADESGSMASPAAGGQALDADVLEGMPDDPDEAMAWMEGLAEQKDEEESLAGEILDDAAPAAEKQFNLARAALSAGAVAEAAKEYRKLLDSGQGGPDLIEELETAVASEPEDPELVQLLGDAYMQNGQMQKALKTYRQGFDEK